MPDPNIEQFYVKAPNREALENVLVARGLATEDEKGVSPLHGLTVWTPLEQEDDPETDTDESVAANYVLALVNWTAHLSEMRGLGNGMDELKTAGDVDTPAPDNGGQGNGGQGNSGQGNSGQGGIVFDVDVSSLGIAPSEPRITIYGA